MKLTTTRRAAQENGIKVLVHGPSGSGKTTLCATTGEPTVIISAEAGLLSLAGHDIPVIEVANIGDVHEAYSWLTSSAEAAEFRWVCLDSISEIAEVCLAAEKSVAKDPRQAYGAMIDQMGTLIRAFRDLPGRSVYMSCKTERTDDPTTGAKLYSPSLPGARLGQGIAYYFDEVFSLRVEKGPDDQPARWLQTGRDYTHEAKDRSGRLALFEPPSLGDIARKILSTQPA